MLNRLPHRRWLACALSVLITVLGVPGALVGLAGCGTNSDPEPATAAIAPDFKSLKPLLGAGEILPADTLEEIRAIIDYPWVRQCSGKCPSHVITMAAVHSEGVSMCSASVDSQGRVVTAAHCVPDWVRAGPQSVDCSKDVVFYLPTDARARSSPLAHARCKRLVQTGDFPIGLGNYDERPRIRETLLGDWAMFELTFPSEPFDKSIFVSFEDTDGIENHSSLWVEGAHPLQDVAVLSAEQLECDVHYPNAFAPEFTNRSHPYLEIPNCPVQPGFSGGPVLSKTGRMNAIITSSISVEQPKGTHIAFPAAGVVNMGCILSPSDHCRETSPEAWRPVDSSKILRMSRSYKKAMEAFREKLHDGPVTEEIGDHKYVFVPPDTVYEDAVPSEIHGRLIGLPICVVHPTGVFISAPVRSHPAKRIIFKLSPSLDRYETPPTLSDTIVTVTHWSQKEIFQLGGASGADPYYRQYVSFDLPGSKQNWEASLALCKNGSR